MLVGLLSLLLALALGYLLVAALIPVGSVGGAAALFRTGVALAVGLGVTSLAFAAATLWLHPSRHTAVGADLAVAAVAALLWRWRPAPPGDHAGPPGGPASPLLRTAALAVLLVAAAGFAAMVRLEPHGEWDAWAVWNQRARFLARGGVHWRDAFAPALAWAPPHPLLLPATVARAWLWAGRDSVVVPAAVAGLFTLATAAVLGGAVAARRGEAQGLLAAITLVGSPAFVRHGASQYADTPLGLFLLIALALAWGEVDGRVAPGAAGLAGLALSLAAWTKTEGLLAVGAVLLGWLVAWAVAGRPGGSRRVLAAVAGMAPAAGLLVYFRAVIAPPNALLVTGTGMGALARLADPARHARVLAAFGHELFSLGGWLVSAGAVLVVYALVAGRLRPVAERGSALGATSALAVILVGYYLVLVVATIDLDYYLAAGLPRLLLQLWPAALLVYWLMVRPPRVRSRSSGPTRRTAITMPAELERHPE